MPLGMLDVDSYNPHTKYACGIGKHYTIITADVDTNTSQGYNGTDGTSFCPTDRCKSTHLSRFSKQENVNKYGQLCEEGN